MIGRLAALLVAVLVAAAAATPTTLAVLTGTGAASASLGTVTLQPPTSVAGVGGATTATLTWTASATAGATGYSLLRSATVGSGYAQVKTVTPASVTSTTDTPGNGAWYYVLQTTLGTWTSAMSNEAAVAVGPADTPLADCTQNAAETSGSGDNNGYEANPRSACGLDGVVATDATSGTGTSTVCTNSGKDRHRFWGYSMAVPGTVTSVNGIRVQLVAAVSSTAGTNMVCVQLSWDGGTSWTAAKSVTLASTSLAAYQLGASSDTWGRTGWTPAQLGPSTFRIRVTDVSSSTARTFRLDQVAAAVNYTP